MWVVESGMRVHSACATEQRHEHRLAHGSRQRLSKQKMCHQVNGAVRADDDIDAVVAEILR
jgi:hypothetical protein